MRHRTTLRFAPLAILPAIAALFVPRDASGQTMPPDQVFAIMDVNMDAAHAVFSVTVAPSTFGCTGSQLFHVHTLAFTGLADTGAGSYTVSLAVPQARQGAPIPGPTPIQFLGMTSPTVAFFSLPSVGAPVTKITVTRTTGWSGKLHAVAWGYCAAPSVLGPLAWQVSG